MKSKASIAQEFMKVSRDLEEALARGSFTACELRIIAWLKARTYGVRVKQGEQWVALDAIAVTPTFLSSDTGLHRRRVREAVEALLQDQVLRRKASGAVGINSRLGEWKRGMQGREFDFSAKPKPDMGLSSRDRSSRGQGVLPGAGQGVLPGAGQGVLPGAGQGVLGVSYARGETVEKGEGERAPTLPNGKVDTPSSRAEAGLVDFSPLDHPGYPRLSFKLQDRLAERWEARVAEERKRTTCTKCLRLPRHSEKWPYCRACTTCARCSRAAGGGMSFKAVKGEIACYDCIEREGSKR